MSTSHIHRTPAKQRGAVLFISMILLIVLSLLGIASMQVTTLQERMAGNYRTLDQSFQAAEGAARDQEVTIEFANDPANNNYFVSGDDFCKNKYGTFNSADAWAQAQTNTGGKKVITRRIDTCGGNTLRGNSLTFGQNQTNSAADKQYEVVSVDADAGTTDSSSLAVIETVFIP